MQLTNKIRGRVSRWSSVVAVILWVSLGAQTERPSRILPTMDVPLVPRVTNSTMIPPRSLTPIGEQGRRYRDLKREEV